MSKPDTKVISVRLPADRLAALDRLAETTGQPQPWHIARALDAYLDIQAWQVEGIEKAIADLDVGKGIPHEEVRKMVFGWGKGDEAEGGD